jgi:lipoate-protein ligase B
MGYELRRLVRFCVRQEYREHRRARRPLVFVLARHRAICSIEMRVRTLCRYGHGASVGIYILVGNAGVQAVEAPDEFDPA